MNPMAVDMQNLARTLNSLVGNFTSQLEKIKGDMTPEQAIEFKKCLEDTDVINKSQEAVSELTKTTKDLFKV